MEKRVVHAVLLTMAMMIPSAALAKGKVPIYLQFWTVRDDVPEPVELVIPRTTDICPIGYLPVGDAHCGKIIKVHLSLNINGELYPGREEVVYYEPTPYGWITFVTGHSDNMYSAKITPFQDGMGLWHHVVGTLKLKLFEDQAWLIDRNPGQPFLTESRKQQPMTVHLECAIGSLSESRASL